MGNTCHTDVFRPVSPTQNSKMLFFALKLYKYDRCRTAAIIKLWIVILLKLKYIKLIVYCIYCQ